MALPLIPIDKANHFIYGLVTATVVAFIASQLGYPAKELAFAAAALVGVGKEAADYIANVRAKAEVHGVEVLDAIATTLGGAIVYLVMGI